MDKQIEILGLDQIEVENTAIDEIDNEEVNLMFLGIDASGSMDTYKVVMQESLKSFKNALVNSKDAEVILVARTDFYDNIIDIGGYKKLEEFETDYRTYGQTPLYDAINNGTDKLIEYMNFLKKEGMRVKAVFAIFSDGINNSSKTNFYDAKAKIEELNKKEITTAFISFGNTAVSEAQGLKFKNILEVGSTESELRRAFNCLSKSVIESSKSAIPKTDDFFNI